MTLRLGGHLRVAFASIGRSSAVRVMSLGKWDISEWYLPLHCGAVLEAMWDMVFATSQWNSTEMNFQPRV